jgi:hypothetical protein
MIPCHQESSSALEGAKRALEVYRGRFWLGNISKVEQEFFRLDLLDEEERFMALDIALQEITPDDRCGPPPSNDRSSHGPFKDCKLFAFKWHSSQFGKEMYFKFGLPIDSGEARLAVYSFHEPVY